MNINKIIIALSMVFSFSAMAMPQIKATPADNGSWVQITSAGEPVANAIVNDSYETDDHGRVFIFNPRQHSRTVSYLAITPDGDQLQTRVYVPQRNNR